VIGLREPLAGDRYGLAGKASGHKVNWLDSSPINGSDVIVAGNGGPVLREDSSAEVIYLHLPPAFHAGAFEPKVNTADAREERAEGHNFHHGRGFP
jgi:hypothetical protein